MKRDYLKRITELEQLEGSQPSTATQLHEVFAKAGLLAPEPAHGEDGRDYLKRVPTESLAGLLAAYRVMEP